jgi:hypothetical protein
MGCAPGATLVAIVEMNLHGFAVASRQQRGRRLRVRGRPRRTDRFDGSVDTVSTAWTCRARDESQRSCRPHRTFPTWQVYLRHRMEELSCNCHRQHPPKSHSALPTMSNPSCRLPWAGLAVADVLSAALRDGGLSVSCEGQSHRVFLIYRQENISERAPHLLVEAALYRPGNKSDSSEVPAPLAREQACSVMCIADI